MTTLIEAAAKKLMTAIALDRHDVGDWPDDSREAYLELKQAIAQEQATHKPAGCRETWKCSHTWKCDNCGNGITLHEGQRYCHTKEMA